MSNPAIKKELFTSTALIGFFLITMLSFAAAAIVGRTVFLLIPPAFILVALSVYDFRVVFFLMLFFLPLSSEYFYSKHLATDLPTEPLIIGLMLVYLMYIAVRPDKIDWKFIVHPLIVLLLLHWVWISVTVVFSLEHLVSVKFLLAKTWYYIVFIFLSALVIKDKKSIRLAFWLIFVPLLFTAIQTLIRHYLHDFNFRAINPVVVPFFRNHVSYGTMLTLFVPFILLARTWYPKGSALRWMLNISFLIFLTGIYFSYTRACLLALFIAAVFYFIIKMRLVIPSMIAGLIGVVFVLAYLINDNRFMFYAPEFEDTIYHSKWGDHISATYQLQDASSMERIYRWIAGARMFMDHPVTGHGPNTFYPIYKEHTVSAFKTYISDNEERSTVHNYYLLMLIEQGIPGFLIFLTITLYSLYLGQRVYRQSPSQSRKNIAMALTLSVLMMYVSLQLSDLVETDKLGSLFFMSLALLVKLDLSNKEVLEKGLSED